MTEPVQTVPIFTSLSDMSLRIMDEYLIRGIALPDELTNATLDGAFSTPPMTGEQKSSQTENIIKTLKNMGHPVPQDHSLDSLTRELQIA